VVQEKGTLDASLSFEQALAELTALVKKLESGQLALEESVAAFEQGVLLSRHCESLLDQADQRLHTLAENNDSRTQEHAVPQSGES
jgi:exodeoxyribonuclease VII small subunit